MYWILQIPCNTVLELRAQCLPYMEGHELLTFVSLLQGSTEPLQDYQSSELSAFLLENEIAQEQVGQGMHRCVLD